MPSLLRVFRVAMPSRGVCFCASWQWQIFISTATYPWHLHILTNVNCGLCLGCRRADWLLVDGMKAGSGEVFDWRGLQQPTGLAANGWFLAGGLEPNNVAEALRIASPTGVDVSSGVTFPDGLRKDPARVRAFIKAVQESRCAV
jgi:hypothetical protein